MPYRNLRETSDRLCKEHGLSIIEKPEGKRLNMSIYKMEQSGMLVLVGAVKMSDRIVREIMGL